MVQVPSLQMKPVVTPATLRVSTVAGVDVVDVPAGLFIMGGPGSKTAPSHWVHCDAFRMAVRPVTEAEYNAVTDREIPIGKEDHPATLISAHDAEAYIVRFNTQQGTQFGLPTEAEHEKAQRGEPVNVRERMEAEGVASSEFVEWAAGRLENFFAHCLGSYIFTDPTEEALRALLASNAPLYGYRMFSTPTGAYDANVLWLDRFETLSVRDVAAEQRIVNGVMDLVGNVWEWLADDYNARAYTLLSPVNPCQRGGDTHRCLRGTTRQGAHAASRGHNRPELRKYYLGLRLALAGSSQGS